jgi:hypothetical protein
VFGTGTRHFVPGSHLPSLRDKKMAKEISKATARTGMFATQKQMTWAID